MSSLITEQRFLNEYQESGWIVRLLVSIFFLFFVPSLLGIVFLILTSPWFDDWLYPMVEDPPAYYVLKFFIFIALSYLITRIYTISIINSVEDQTFNVA